MSEGERKNRVGLIFEAGETSLSTRKLLIETAGFNSLSAVNGAQGLKFAEQHSVDFILYDVDVHDLPIRETIGKLREKYPQAPVYLLTPRAGNRRNCAEFPMESSRKCAIRRR
jgi:DNA-binding response OmpR family regulator